MSLVEQQPAWVITLQDETGSSSLVRGFLQAGMSAADHLSAVAGLVAALSPITGCVPIRYAVNYLVKEIVPTGPMRSDQIRDRGRFVFTLTDPPSAFAAVTLPVTEDLFITTGCRAGLDIDPALSVVSDFVSGVADGIWCDPFGDDLAALCRAYRLEHR